MDAVRNLEVTFRSLGGGSKEQMSQEINVQITLLCCHIVCRTNNHNQDCRTLLQIMSASKHHLETRLLTQVTGSF